jgi:hypothetical protein
MKKILACIAVAATLVPFSAQAGERVPDAGLGALAGALAFGWQGAVAGAATGYIAGPSISHALGLHGHRYHRRRHAHH